MLGVWCKLCKVILILYVFKNDEAETGKTIGVMPSLKQIQTYLRNCRTKMGDSNNLDEIKAYINEKLLYLKGNKNATIE